MRKNSNKLISYSLLFLTVFSIGFLIPEEPVYASGEFACADGNGAPYAYHMEFSGDDVTVYQWDVSNGEYDTAETFDFGPLTGTTNQINGFTMDLVGNMYAIYQPTSGNKRLIKMNYNASGAGTITDLGAVSNSSSGDVNAGTFIQQGGNDYIVFSKGMGDGGLYYAQLSNSTTMSASGAWTQNSTFNDGASKKQAKDYAWIRDGLEISGTTYNLMGVDLKNDAVILGIWAGPGTAVELVDYDIDSKPSGWGSTDTVGAMYGFGGDVVYASNNQEGEMGKLTWDGSAFDITKQGDSEASSNNDGAACHGGDPTVDFNPTVSAAAGSCSSGNKPVDVTLTNTNSETTANFVVTYTLNGGGSVALNGGGTNVNAGAQNTDLSIPAQANGTTVVVSWYAENTSTDNRSPASGTTTLSTITISTSDCPSGTVVTGLGSCSNGSATSTIVLTANNSTMYFDVQYSTDGGSSWTDLKDGEAVSAGSPETYSTPAQADGTTVSWQFRTDTSNPSSGSYTAGTARTVDCDPNSSVSQSLGSCSSGAKTSTLSITNSDSSTAYYLVEYSLDGGSSWSQKAANQSVSAGATNTSLTQSVSDGQTITWRIKDSFTSGNFTNMSYETESASSEVDCPYIDTGASQALGSCSGTSKTSTLTLTNSSSANTAAYFQVRYSTDGGSSWTEKAANQSVSANGSAQLTQSVAHGSTIIWSYRTSSTSGSFSGNYTNLSASDEVDCPPTTPTTEATTTTTAATTTTTTTTTTTLPPDIFRPIINNERVCNTDESVGGGDYAFQFNHEDATVDASLKLIVYIDKIKVSESTYTIPAGANVSIITISNVEEDAKYKLKFEISNEYTNQTTVGKFTKKTNCIKENAPTTTVPLITTTTTIPEIMTTDDVDIYVTTTTTTIPDEIGDPLTEEEGNDYFVWDYEEDVYFTDGNFIVQYIYQENYIQLADTGKNFASYIYFTIVTFIMGMGVFLTSRLKDLNNIKSFISSQELENKIDKVKVQLETFFNETIDISVITSRNIKKNVFNTKKTINELFNISFELDNVLFTLKDFKSKYGTSLDNGVIDYRNISIEQESFERYLYKKRSNSLKRTILSQLLGSSSNIEIRFTDKKLTKQLFNIDMHYKESNLYNLFRNKDRKISLAFSSIFLTISMFIGSFSIHEAFLTNFVQANSQEILQEIYYADNLMSSSNTNIGDGNINDTSDQNKNTWSLKETIIDFFVGDNNNNIDQEEPRVYGVLEVPSINLKQYVTEGTNEDNLELGPGKYLSSNSIEDSSSNIAIAGHRTTFGAPFKDLDYLNIGDEIILTHNNKKYIYIVDQTHIVDRDSGDYVLYNQGDTRITLTTCHPKYSAKQRLIVSGVLKTIEN